MSLSGGSGDLEKVRDMLRDLRPSMISVDPKPPQTSQAPLLQYPGIVPVESYAIAEKQMDLVEEQIKAYLAKPITIGKISERFLKFNQVIKDIRAVSYKYTDDIEKNKPGITLYKTTANDVAILGREVLPMMTSGFSRKGAASIFMLAYNAVAPGGDHTEQLFPDVSMLESINDEAYTYFPDMMLSTGPAADLLEFPPDVKEEATVYSFIALSLLRLFTKSHTSYVLAWDHIKKGYSRFYGNEIKIPLSAPTEVALKGLANWFAIEPRAKQSLYRILYVGNDPPKHWDLKRFAYEMHLANAGMHLASMFVTLGSVLNCNADVLLQAINVREFERQLECLKRLLELVQSPLPDHKRKMWRYGRIFDETFMADIQTKSCAKLVYIFAAALKMKSPKTHEKILNIAALADVSDANKRKCEDEAQKLIEAVQNFYRKDERDDRAFHPSCGEEVIADDPRHEVRRNPRSGCRLPDHI